MLNLERSMNFCVDNTITLITIATINIHRFDVFLINDEIHFTLHFTARRKVDSFLFIHRYQWILRAFSAGISLVLVHSTIFSLMFFDVLISFPIYVNFLHLFAYIPQRCMNWEKKTVDPMQSSIEQKRILGSTEQISDWCNKEIRSIRPVN